MTPAFLTQHALGWAAAGITFLAFLTACGKAILCASRASQVVVKLEALIPVVFDMAAQFQKNGGSSLKDVIEEIQAELKAQGEVARTAAKMAEDAKASADAATKTGIRVMRSVNKTQAAILHLLQEKGGK